MTDLVNQWIVERTDGPHAGQRDVFEDRDNGKEQAHTLAAALNEACVSVQIYHKRHVLITEPYQWSRGKGQSIVQGWPRTGDKT